MIHHTQLCLACSASLPPNLFKQPIPSSSSSSNRLGPESPSIFLTPCCTRPICPTCTTRNPRLMRYNPCLVCVHGIGVLEASGSSSSTGLAKKSAKKGASNISSDLNLNGEVRDEDTFVVGDDDEEGMLYDDSGHEREIEEEEASNHGADVNFADSDTRSPSPNQFTTTSTAIDSLSTLTLTETSTSQLSDLQPQEESNDDPTRPYKYFLNRSDTLQGLSLRFGIPVHEICKLNTLPPSILRSPHLLHTRTFILLPASASLKPHPSLVRLTSQESQNLDDSDKITKAREQRRAKERAEKKLQLLTKEVDWRVARVYVALADDPSTQDEAYGKEAYEKGIEGKKSKSNDSDGMEYLAIERYLDDMEWEEGEKKAGRNAKLPKFPYADFGEASSSSKVSPGRTRQKEVADSQKGESTVLWSPTRADEFDSGGADSIRGLGLGLAKGVGVGVGVMGGWFKKI
ncbi:hypothetical protein CPB83DRAFT_846988 [Crepidotus variabilis]|uniref:LysM domain-containing protein n=1 Tax=Crepidotus variabilis TaxID=179855 RepID=A0A9P6EMQ5_9AGAR|nr:hypothetical protein CPB83DRAFT_846988 [Crepidotus variabilis]